HHPTSAQVLKWARQLRIGWVAGGEVRHDTGAEGSASVLLGAWQRARADPLPNLIGRPREAGDHAALVWPGTSRHGPG
ncbi:MAG TPA: hypothetical protein VN520_30505, partial [Streptomyces sp.]|uniref:hypothetical protein n=1 Tax=Streptomyces sp. TaxID=1931 RepID=UPI002C409177